MRKVLVGMEQTSIVVTESRALDVIMDNMGWNKRSRDLIPKSCVRQKKIHKKKNLSIVRINISILIRTLSTNFKTQIFWWIEEHVP